MKRIVFLVLFFTTLSSIAQNKIIAIDVTACRSQKSIDDKINCIKQRVSHSIATNLSNNITTPIINAITSESIKIHYTIEPDGSISYAGTGLHPVIEIEDFIESIFTEKPVLFQRLKSEEGKYLKISIDHELIIEKKEDQFKVAEFTSEMKKPEIPFERAKYSTCNRKKGKKAATCTASKIHREIQYNFDKYLGSKLGITGVNRIFVSFTVTKEGEVSNIRARAPHPKLEDEVESIISQLPKFIPATYKGIPVSSRFSLPITYTLQ